MSDHTPDAELTPEKIESMTVKLLKEELKARQLPISGLKAELAVRLHSYLEGLKKPATAATVTPGAPPASPAKSPAKSKSNAAAAADSSQSSSAAPMDTAAEPTLAESKTESQADSQSESQAQTPQNDKKRKLVRSTSGSSDTPSKPEAASSPAPAPTPTPAPAAPITIDTAAPPAKPPADADSASPAAVTPSGSTPSEEPTKRRIMNVKRRAEEKAAPAQPSPTAESHKKQKRPVGADMATSDLVDSIMQEENEKEAAEQELRLKLKEKAANRQTSESESKQQKSEVYDSSARDDVSVDFNEEEEARQPEEGAQAEEGANGAVEPESKERPAEDQAAEEAPAVTSSNCIRVDGFVRPFPVPHAKELMSKQGALEKFWMDGIRSHCYVQYATEAEAAAAVAALTGLSWPPDNKGTLSAKLVTQAELTAASSAETKLVGAPKRAFVDVGADLKAPAREPKPKKVARPVKTLDELFRKTTARPPIYYQPLTEEQAAQREAAKKAGLPMPNFLVDPNKPKEEEKKPTTPRADSARTPRGGPSGGGSRFLDRDYESRGPPRNGGDRDRDRGGSDRQSDRRGRGRDEPEEDWLSAREKFQTSGEMEAELKRDAQRKRQAQRSGLFGYKS